MRSTSVSPYAILKQLIQFEKKIMQRLKTLEIKNEYYYLQQVERQKGSTKQKRQCSSDTQFKNSATRKFINRNQKQIMSANTIMTTSIDNMETNLISTSYRRSRMNPHETQDNSRFASLNRFRKLSESHQLHHKIYNIGISQDGMVIGCSKIANRNAYITVDTGYPRSLISIEFLSKLSHRMDKRRRRPAPHMATMVVENMQLPIVCSISLPITINGMTRFHNLLVVHHLSRECIIGADFIDKHSVQVKIRSDQVQFNQKNNCFTEIPNQKHIPIHHNNAFNLIEHNNYLSTHSSDTEQALSKACISTNVSRPNILISTHERI